MLEPHKTTVVEVREDRGDRTTGAWLSRRLGSPCTPVQMREEKLIHRIVGSVGFEDYLT